LLNKEKGMKANQRHAEGRNAYIGLRCQHLPFKKRQSDATTDVQYHLIVFDIFEDFQGQKMGEKITIYKNKRMKLIIIVKAAIYLHKPSFK
jgi:hypothetical protein